MHYHSKVLHYFAKTDNVGSLPENLTHVTSASVGTVTNGDVIKLSVQTDATNHIVAAKFQAQASVATVACCAFITEWALGKPLLTAKQMTAEWLMTELSLPTIKKHCALLVINAVQQL